MKYKIKYEYTTGNSFNTYSEEGLLELSNCDLSIGKQNLLRIQEHYIFSRKYDRATKVEKETLVNSSKDKDWYVVGKWPDQCVILKTDTNTDLQIHCPWIGYFERLHSIELILDPEGMKIEF